MFCNGITLAVVLTVYKDSADLGDKVPPMIIVWTDYLKYRASTREFDLSKLEQILRRSTERYLDTGTGSLLVIGRHENQIVVIAYEADGEEVTPITVHATSRQQVLFRVRTGRFTYE